MAKATRLTVNELKQVASEFSGAILLIDGKNLAHRCAHAVKDNMRESFNRAIQSICFMIDLFMPIKVIIAWDDTTERLWRSAEYPQYKQKRKRDPIHDSVVKHIQDVVINVSDHFGIHTLWATTQEADDLIAAACYSIDEKIIVASNDGDMWQLLNLENVTVFDPLNRRIIEKTDRTCFDIENSVRLKALEGDNSDNIEGYIGIGPVTSAKILREDRLDMFLMEVGRDKYDINVALIDLLNSPYMAGNIEIVKAELNRNLFPINPGEAVKIAISKKAGLFHVWPKDLAQRMRGVGERWLAKSHTSDQ